MALSLVKLAEVGRDRYVAATPEIQELIRSFKKGSESNLTSDQDTILRAVVKADVQNERVAKRVTERLVLSGKAFLVVQAAEEVDRMLDQCQKYIPVFRDYKFAPKQSNLGDILRYTQPESIFEMVLRAKEVVGRKGQIVWDGAFAIAKQYYGKKTWEGQAPKERTIIPFLEGSNKKPFFQSGGLQEDKYQMGYVKTQRLDDKNLVVADYGEDLIALMLDLMNQGFPNASVAWRWSRAFINNGENDDAARLGSLRRNVDGVGVFVSVGYADDDVFAGASLES